MVFEPTPAPSFTPSQIRETETPPQPGVTQNTGLPVPQLPGRGPSSGAVSLSHSAPSSLLLRLSSRRCSQEERTFFCPAPVCGLKALHLKCGTTENTGALTAFAMGPRQRHWEKERTCGYRCPLPPSAQPLTQCHSERGVSLPHSQLQSPGSETLPGGYRRL